uniref:Tudor domain-containing protein n=1 Tax=Setaria digitata TaxID=48799 RepID=A0A915PD03_9BILA
MESPSVSRRYVQKGFFYKCLLKFALTLTVFQENVSKDLDDFGLYYQPIRTALATRIQMPNLPPLMLPVVAGEYVRARISYVADCERVFVQLQNNARTILKVGERLKELENRRHEPLCNPECGVIIAALYPLDRCYYRACVFSKIDLDSVFVFYIDYGNMASVNIGDAFLLKDPYLLSVPPQAIQLIIKDVKRPRLTSEQISNLLTDQTVGAQIVGVSWNGESFIANLFLKDEKGRNINLTEVILGERPAPTLPAPETVTMDEFSDVEDESLNYMCQSRQWKRSVANYRRPGSTDEQVRSKIGSFSGSFRSKTSGSDSNSIVVTRNRNDGKTRRNFCEPGRSTYRGSINRESDFDRNESRTVGNRKLVGDSASERFLRSVSNRFVEHKAVSSHDFNSGLSVFRRGGQLRKRGGSESSQSFLDHDAHSGDTAVDKSGWKSGSWVATSSMVNGGDEFNRPLNSDFKKADVENWNINVGGWETNNDSRGCVDDNSETKGVQPTPTSGVLENGRNHSESIEATGKLPISVYSEKTDGSGTVINLPSYPKPDNSITTQLSAVTFNRIKSSSLEDIKFGDLVDGIRSDGSIHADPSSFFVQLNRDESSIEHLILSEAQLPDNLPKLFSFEISQACIAIFMGEYYRAEIIEEGFNNKKKILFVDYGNVEIVSTSGLYLINESLPEQFCALRRMAFHCRLHDVMPVAFKCAFDMEARKVFSELTANEKLGIRFHHQSIKGIYDVTITLSNGRSVSDVLISRGFAAPFKWGVGPLLPLYETLNVLRSDEFAHVQAVFTIQLSDCLAQLEELNSAYVDSKETVEVPQIGDVVIAYFEGSPYRAEIIEMESNSGSYRVVYVDYGNENVCTKEELFVLDKDQQPDEILYTPRQGIRCRIDGVQPRNGVREWPDKVQKCIDSLISSTSFEAAFGSPSMDGVYPIRIMVPKKQLNGDVWGTDETNNVEDRVDLAGWLVAKGYAETEAVWRDYPVMNLLSDGQHEYEMLITEIDGEIIRARPCIFDRLYAKMKQALVNIEAIPLVTNAATGLIILNKENKRAALISSNDTTQKKCLLVDEGISVDHLPVQFYGINGLCDLDGLLVRTCHHLSVQLRFTKSLLNEKLKQMILSGSAIGPAKVILVEYNVDNSYLISEIFFSDGTTLTEKFEEVNGKGTSNEESASDFSADVMRQGFDEKSVDSKSSMNGSERVICSKDYLIPQVIPIIGKQFGVNETSVQKLSRLESDFVESTAGQRINSITDEGDEFSDSISLPERISDKSQLKALEFDSIVESDVFDNARREDRTAMDHEIIDFLNSLVSRVLDLAEVE